MEDYSCYLFDWDGCLARTLDVWLGAYAVVYRELGIHLSEQQIADLLGDWAPPNVGVTDPEAFNKRLAELVEERSARTELYPGALDTLKLLRGGGKRLALLTSSLRPIIRPGLEYNHIEEYFDVILTAEDVPRHKPDPQVVIMALEKLGVEAREAVMVGDSSNDVLAASAAGVDTILIYPEDHRRYYTLQAMQSLGATYLYQSFAEFKTALPAQK